MAPEALPGGSVSLTLLNVYSSLVLRTPRLTVLFDPVKLDLARLDIRSVDAIVITHEHTDHFDEKLVLEIQRADSAIILTTPFVARRLERLGGTARAMTPGGSAVLGDLVFHTEECDHAANGPVTFIVETGRGTIFHSADSRPFPAMRDIALRHRPDLLLYFSHSEGDLFEICKLVKPARVVTCTAPSHEGCPLPGIEVVRLRHTETFRY